MLCKKCGKNFFSKHRIDGKVHNLNNRKYCLECSPFGKHNTRKIHGPDFEERFSRICTKCNKQFSSNHGKRKNLCGSCSVVETRKQRKIELVDYFGSKCQICGYDKCISALEFHHLLPENKKWQIAGNTRSMKKMKKESEDCVLLCSNCHREHHAGLLDIEKTLREKNSYVAGSTPAAGEARREREERQYFAIVDARLYDHCKLDN